MMNRTDPLHWKKIFQLSFNRTKLLEAEIIGQITIDTFLQTRIQKAQKKQITVILKILIESPTAILFIFTFAADYAAENYPQSWVKTWPLSLKLYVNWTWPNLPCKCCIFKGEKKQRKIRKNLAGKGELDKTSSSGILFLCGYPSSWFTQGITVRTCRGC